MRNGRTEMNGRVATVSDILGGGVGIGGVPRSLTPAIKRTPFRITVRITDCAEPLSPTARRTALMRVVIADSETMRPPHTAAIRSSRLTTRSRFCTR